MKETTRESAYDEHEAAEAYAAYIGILAHEKADPSLTDNPSWVNLRNAAYAQYFCAYVEVEQ